MTLKQRINELRNDERAVSPVIGVILMVAITVILAAVIGTFVLDLGQSVGDTGPTASVSFSDADTSFDASTSGDQDAFVLEHQGGDELELQQMRIVVRNESDNSIALDWDGSNGKNSETGQWDISYNDNNITTGASQTMNSGDIILLELDTSGSSPPSEGYDYKISFVDTDTDSTVGAATIQLK